MSAACTSRPISWLALERFHLGECPPAERSRIAGHLESCPACRSCLDRIQQDAGTELRPLALPASPSARSRKALWPWLGLAAAAAAAAILALVLLHPGSLPDRGAAFPGKRVAVKGGELALSLVRDRGGVQVSDPGTYRSGDRFKVLVTCPPGEVFVEVAVFEENEVGFPLPAGQALACRNLAPIPGAFALTGIGEAHVCVTIDAAPVDRAALSARPWRLPPQSVCERLVPAQGVSK